MFVHWKSTLAASVLLFAGTAAVQAQSRDGERPQPSEAERRMGYYEQSLKRWDTSGNGSLETKEISENSRRKAAADGILKQAGLPVRYPVRISSVMAGLQRRAKAGSLGQASKGGTSSAQGFGKSSNGSGSKGFGASDRGSSSSTPSRPSAPSRSYSGRSSGSSDRPSPSPRSSPSDAELRRRFGEPARVLLRKYDTNKNSKLEREEWGRMRGNPEWADRNRDGIISHEELTDKMIQDYAKSQDRSSGGDSSRTDRSHSSGNSPTRVKIRFRTAIERLPEGIPSEFTRKDADEDGQVSMAEWTKFWSDGAAKEFVALDLNGDGIITAREWLKAEEED